MDWPWVSLPGRCVCAGRRRVPTDNSACSASVTSVLFSFHTHPKSHCEHVMATASFASASPPKVEPLANRSVTLNGSGFVDGTADSAWFVVAASCAGASVTPVATVTTSAFTNTSAVVLTINASVAGAVGARRLCVRWASSASYQDVLGLDIGELWEGCCL